MEEGDLIILVGIGRKDVDEGENPDTCRMLEWGWSNIIITNVALIEEVEMMPVLLSEEVLVDGVV